MFSLKAVEKGNQMNYELMVYMEKDIEEWDKGIVAAVKRGNFWMKLSIERYNVVKTYFHSEFVDVPGSGSVSVSADDLEEYEDFSDELKRLFLPDGEPKLMEYKIQYDIIKSPKKCQYKASTKRRFRKKTNKTVIDELLEIRNALCSPQLALVSKEFKVSYPTEEKDPLELVPEEVIKESIFFYEAPLNRSRRRSCKVKYY
ncbi:uncharacterized protein [Drosophila pseudoobscura]|uniref:Uncharacterized protein isoform X1 n=1 Tax=Drosophila pseudoobscura pseudoobscura TaxID=46245 RepID=A0A6I8VZB5_DROPS|nr:uncharacterized protein LOC6903264 isoform X1 [Drosophila pseudoobscura]XP_033236333.1 uncharacterized protein LOC6903264 isoform X1 [Drosophila pseudoobscura]XP_033236334.1 uncharacterized protein LOC6903264 isoform X1 [Drosophila pseudoobscura]